MSKEELRRFFLPHSLLELWQKYLLLSDQAKDALCEGKRLKGHIRPFPLPPAPFPPAYEGQVFGAAPSLKNTLLR